jgi:hypothetical protein
MSGAGDIYLGTLGAEVLITPFGRKLRISDNEISREERTASGRLVRDIVATKKKIVLAFSEIDASELDTLLNIYDLQDELSLLIYHTDPPGTTDDESNYYDAYTVLMKPLDRERLLLGATSGIWTGIDVELNEV